MARRAQTEKISNDGESETRARGPTVLNLVEPPPAGARARQLHQDARAISLEHLAEVAAALATLRDQLETVVEGGDLYAPGLHAFAERLSEDLFWRGKSFEALLQRQREGTAARPRR